MTTENQQNDTAQNPTTVESILNNALPVEGEKGKKKTKGGQGHKDYRENCSCARCKRTRIGIEAREKSKKEIIEQYLLEFPPTKLKDNEVIFALDTDAVELFKNKIQALKKLYPNNDYSFNQFLNSLLKNFLNKI